jgi:hypothetical protein
MSELPARLSDTKKPAIIDVDFVDKVSIEETAVEALKTQGCVILGQKCITDLAVVGQYIRGVGVLRHQRGRAIITQQKLDQVFNSVLDILRDGKTDSKGKKKNLTPTDIQRLSQAAAAIASANTRSQEFMLKVEHLAKPTENDDATPQPQVKPFMANMDVKPPSSGTLIVAQTVHTHSASEKSDLPNVAESPKPAP